MNTFPRGNNSSGFLFFLLGFLIVFNGTSYSQCEPTRPLIKRWIVGFGNNADIFNGFHFGLFSAHTHTNGMDIAVVQLTQLEGNSIDRRLKSTIANGFMLGIVGLNADRVNGLAFGTLWANPQKMNGLALSPFVTTSRRLNGIGIAGLVSYYIKQINGISFAPLVSYSAVNINGISASLLVSGAGRNVRGLCLGGLYAGNNGQTKGLLVAGAVTNSGNMRGLQAAAINYADDIKGLQLGGINIMNYGQGGSQLGLFNFGTLSNETKGAHFSNGAQIGFLNSSRRHRGIQVGVINYCRNLGGLQLGLLNINRMNPKWCRVIPLLNFSQYKYPFNHRKTLPKLPKIKGSIVVKTKLYNNETLEEQILNGQREGLSRHYQENCVDYEKYYLHDSLVKTVWYKEVPFDEEREYWPSYSRDDINNYVVDISEHEILKSYLINSGDTMSYTINGFKEGLWKSKRGNILWKGQYLHDSLTDSYYLYTGKNIHYSDPSFGEFLLKTGDRISSWNNEHKLKQYFSFGGENSIYLTIIQPRGSTEETWKYYFDLYQHNKLSSIVRTYADSSISMDARKKILKITTKAGWKSYFSTGAVHQTLENKSDGKKFTAYRKNGTVLYEEECNSAFLDPQIPLQNYNNAYTHDDSNSVHTLKPDSAGIRDSSSLPTAEPVDSTYRNENDYGDGYNPNIYIGDTMGTLHGNEYFKDGKPQAYFLWKGKHIKQGKVFWKNGNTRIDAFPKPEYLLVYYYKRNGVVHKIRKKHNYGPLRKHMRESELKPYFNPAICN